MKSITNAATEAGAATAIASGVAFAFSGAYVPAVLAGGIGVALFVAYEYFGVTNLPANEEDINRFVNIAAERLEQESGIGDGAVDEEYDESE